MSADHAVELAGDHHAHIDGGRQPMQTTPAPATAIRHPLEPLSAAEIDQAAEILRREKGLAATARFVYVMLEEPPKAEVLAYQPGDPIDRRAFIVIRERAQRATYEAVVSITAGAVLSWQHLPDAQTSITLEEWLTALQTVKQDIRWQEALRKRGVSDFENVIVDPWPLGYDGPDDDPRAGRFLRPLTWIRTGPDDNGYARPVEGLVVRFDLDRMEVVEVQDHGVVPLPPRAGNYDPERIKDPNNFPHFPNGARSDLEPLAITQPNGPSFEVEGHRVTWQKWSFRIGFNPREGLVLHTIGYQDKGRTRPIVYRASLSEMFVPYGDPRPTHYRKNVFDMGEAGVGMLANTLELGCDCLGEIHYFDGVGNDNDGRAVTIANAICMHEEDHGQLWKHTDLLTGAVGMRRSRRLVISMVATIANYEYGYFWYLYQDGTIEYEIKLSGIISTGALPLHEKPKNGSLVAPGVYGPNHQHFFNVRLDMMVDGPDNTVHELNSEAVPPGVENPYGNAWVVTETPLTRESDAQRLIDPFMARSWKIVNSSEKNAVGESTAYRLVPHDNVLPFYQPDAHAIRRAGFATKHLWVTAHDPGERYAAGAYPNQHPGGAGLPAYVTADRPLDNTDVVVWYTFGAHHVVRPEDWPVMPVQRVGFHLQPYGFFDGNPALDVPPVAPRCHRDDEAGA
jgi:primary-amine oxidase